MARSGDRPQHRFFPFVCLVYFVVGNVFRSARKMMKAGMASKDTEYPKELYECEFVLLHKSINVFPELRHLTIRHFAAPPGVDLAMPRSQSVVVKLSRGSIAKWTAGFREPCFSDVCPGVRHFLISYPPLPSRARFSGEGSLRWNSDRRNDVAVTCGYLAPSGPIRMDHDRRRSCVSVFPSLGQVSVVSSANWSGCPGAQSAGLQGDW